jgi:hypothetical protein
MFHARDRNAAVKAIFWEILIRRQAQHHRSVFDHEVSVILAAGFGAETLKTR